MNVVYSPETRDYHSLYQPGYPNQRPDAESSLPRNLFVAVAVLGLATYVFSFGPVAGGPETVGWDVRFAALAALCGMLGLLARQNPLPLAIAVLATMGFLDALSNMLAGTDRGWPLTVIVVLNALQSAAAVVALLLAPKAAKQSDTAGYDAYVDYYNQAVRDYYDQQSLPVPAGQTQRAGSGQAYGDAYASSRAQRTQRPSQQGDYADLDYSGSGTTAPVHDTGASAPGPTGLPSFGQAASARGDQPLTEADESTQPSSSA